MPLLSRRRSLLDLLNTANGENEWRPKTSENTLRPHPPADAERPKSEYGYSRSRLSHEVLRGDIADPKDSQDGASARAKRFSMLKMRNYSESQLSTRAKEAEKKDKENRPPMPTMPSSSAVPSIVKTAPTMDHFQHGTQEAVNPEESERNVRPSLFKRSLSKGRSPSKREARKSTDEKRGEKQAERSPSRRQQRKSTDEKRPERKGTTLGWRKMQGRSTGLKDLQRLAASHTSNGQAAPPSYGDESNSALALPLHDHRFSESSRSDGSNGSDPIYGSTTTTTHTVSTHTTFFKLPRRNKNRNSLFPLPIKIPPPNDETQQDDPPTPRASTGGLSTKSQQETSDGRSVPVIPRRHTETSPAKQIPLSTNAALAKSSLSFAEPGMNLFRNDSQRSRGSGSSSPLQPPRRLGMRDRASTTSSFGRSSHDMGTPPLPTGSGRNSTSTTGRSSLGGLLTLSRFRQSSDPHSPRYGSPGTGSKSNSFAMSREALVVPEREEGDTPGKYLERLEAAVARSMIAGILSKSADPFAQAVLRSYTRRFPFFGEPIDMSLRKFLLEADLPKETQQVDRVIQAFADRYHECNPGIFVAPDQAYIIAFSLMMLHTDAFNKNNKRKMQKQDYIKNTSGQQVSDDVLGCFYDNICYTPFVHFEEDVDINGERVLPFKPKKNKVKAVITDANKKPSGPVDPYNLLVDQKLDMLRPPIRDTITMEDPYNYRGTQNELDRNYMQRAFTHTGVLQIVSQRSRPTAYEGQLTNGQQPSLTEMQPGIIDIKITKVGTLWRKAAKKKKARSPWQEWGAILTGSQLYLFKNAHWAKGLVHQFEAAQARGKPRTPVTFKPPLQQFKPDALIKTDNAVALVDATYNRHKNAFTFIGPGCHEEVLLADNESELNDWLALINYAAAFRSAGVRIRGMVGGAEEDSRSKDVNRLEPTQSARSVQSAQFIGGEMTMMNRGLTPQLQRQVMTARRQIMVQKVAEASKEITETNQQLESMLRNARHLLVLAPIIPKTRDEVILAAARTDVDIKWTRRDIWRMKCYKDILAMDVQQDGVSATDIEAFAAEQVDGTDSAKKTRARGLSRLNSKASAARSSPHMSPTSPNHLNRPSTTGSLESWANDVFRTPPESATQQREGDWRLPPLQLDVQAHEQHRASTSSALLSTSSHDRNSVSQASTTSSVNPVAERAASDATTEGTARGRASSATIEDRNIELLARTTLSPERMNPLSSRMNMDGTSQPISTPESSKQRSAVRRSLQKTLRDAHHHPSTIHKHKKGKESDSTVRSAERAASNGDTADIAVEEGTPGLKREKGRFILHGKQASVVHFGSDWPNERMRARREAWRQTTGSSAGSPNDESSTPRAYSYGFSRADGSGSTMYDFGQGWSPGSAGLRGDAEAAEAFADATSASPVEMSRKGSSASEAADHFLASQQSGGKRETVIGPIHKRKMSLQKSDDGGIISETEEDEDDVSQGTPVTAVKGKRTTVVGPSTRRVTGGSTGTTNGGAEEGDESTSDDHENDALRPMSSHRAVEVR
ncbi:hypothetical protein LTR37_005016 [Vermiconidia calcicola]|uniref:Uncharacterized protein n=1 Tax=Vermiconidia calcicola TaxID=1690605 RepID=A0ACC3NLZ1_9PEZI|nr:hypothetical protein LTR37_005016 [Vermiconidia calcicola]